MIKALEKLRRGERILPPPGGIDCDDDNDYGYMFYNEKHWKSNISFPPGAVQCLAGYYYIKHGHLLDENYK